MKRMIQGLLLAGSLVVGGAALAQGTTQGANQGGITAKVGKGMAKDGMVEHMGFMVPADNKAMLERLHHINQMEIQLGRLAQQNGASQDVKSYGETLVKDHTAADQKLMTYAQQKGMKLSQPKPLNEVERKSMAAHKANMEKLQVLKGQPFDAYFLAIMVGDHDEALGKLMAAQQNVTDPAVTPLLQQHAQAVTQHRQQAHTLLGRIGPGASTGVGGAGDMHQGMGTGGAGDVDRDSKGTGDKNTLDPGSQKKF